MFAPKILLHPDEEYFPMNPLLFVSLSRFRRHVSWGRDYGYNKVTRKWVRTDEKSPEYYDIPLNVLEGFALNKDRTNRRPRDKNRGNTENVFLQPDGKPKGNFDPTGNVPCFYNQVDSNNAYIFHQYWFFFGYNPSLVILDLSHQGDWEDYTAVTKGNELIGGILNAHGKRTCYRKEQLEFDREQVQIYCALGTHALFPISGSFGKFKTDKTKPGGYTWDSSKNVEVLFDQPWRDYAGAWGEVGELPATTGPLGPYYKKIEQDFFS